MLMFRLFVSSEMITSNCCYFRAPDETVVLTSKARVFIYDSIYLFIHDALYS